MLVVTSPDIPGKKIVKTLGIVKGNTIRARHIGKDILAAFKNIVGGEIQEYTKLMAESREQAIDRMIESAEKMGANAIISTTTTTSVRELTVARSSARSHGEQCERANGS